LGGSPKNKQQPALNSETRDTKAKSSLAVRYRLLAVPFLPETVDGIKHRESFTAGESICDGLVTLPRASPAKPGASFNVKLGWW
jgi:hypothetical protein